MKSSRKKERESEPSFHSTLSESEKLLPYNTQMMMNLSEFMLKVPLSTSLIFAITNSTNTVKPTHSMRTRETSFLALPFTDSHTKVSGLLLMLIKT